MSIVSALAGSGHIRRSFLGRGASGSLAVALALLGAGCNGSFDASSGDGAPRIVAAENVWGGLAAELAGTRADVASVVSSPAADPHDYEPSAADARALAGAQMAIVSGIGYDPWASRLLAANPVAGRIVLDVGDLLGLEAGANPHRWYSPRDVQLVVGAIVRDYAKLDPRSAEYFTRRRRLLEQGLRGYRHLLASIRKSYRNVPVGASESIAEPLAQALGLRLLTPRSFLDAVSEGSEPTAADRTTIDRQIARRQIAVWLYNRQNATPDVTRITEEARRRGIPVVPITETLSPASSTFESWQSRQLRSLSAALAKGTGR
jgi:zinc/manganese transport system substrate-binding protein